MTLCKRIKTTSGSLRKYQFPVGELVVYVGTKKPCKLLIEGLSYITKDISRQKAACALKQLKRDARSITPDYKIESEV